MIDYSLKHFTRSARIRLRVNAQGEVIVSAPKGMSKSRIDQFVVQQNDWIKRQQHKFQLRKMANPVLDWEKNLVMFKGVLYPFSLDLTIGEKVLIHNNHLLVRPITLEAKDLRKSLLAWLKLQASLELTKSTKQMSKAMQLQVSTITFRQQASRWGSCSSKGNLSFNWRLIHFAPEIMEYVVIHELAHRIHMNHSRAFWSVVALYDPNFLQHRAYLKRQVVSLEKL